jgi:hypothetical protein
MEAAEPNTSFHAEVRVQMKGEHGYLSATEWPLLLVSNSNAEKSYLKKLHLKRISLIRFCSFTEEIASSTFYTQWLGSFYPSVSGEIFFESSFGLEL